MTTRKRLPDGAKRHAETAEQSIQSARAVVREIRADLQKNPDQIALVREKLADLEVELADAQRFLMAALLGAKDDL